MKILSLESNDILILPTELKMADNIYDTDPVMIWTSIRPWVASNISCWDILCDKGKWADYPSVSMTHNHDQENAFAHKIQVNLFLKEYFVGFLTNKVHIKNMFDYLLFTSNVYR